jgi:hypothetical protein
MKTTALLLTVLLTLSMAGCAQPSDSMRTRAIGAAHIEKGVTTEHDLVAQLGEPQVRGFDFKNRKMLTWNRIDVSSSNKLSTTVLGRLLPNVETVIEPELTVSFDSSDRVVAWRLAVERHRYR